MWDRHDLYSGFILETAYFFNNDVLELIYLNDVLEYTIGDLRYTDYAIARGGRD
jgi:hypothetical protein